MIDNQGTITWTPATNQVPGVYLFETKVSDAGIPPLSSTNAFEVFVLPEPPPDVPIIRSVALDNTNAIITWSSLADRTYRVEYADEVQPVAWTQVTPDVIATGAQTTLTNAPANGARRFYRVVLLP